MRLAGSLLIAALSASVTAAGQPAAPAPPPAGRLVDVGGWRMHINCSGDAQPGRPTPLDRRVA